MKSNVFLALASCFLLMQNTYQAQVSAYTFTQTAGTYGSASTGTLIGATLQDDDVNAVSLPFVFNYDGIGYSSVNVCSNGYLSFNSLNGFEYTAISDFFTQNVISAFGNDLFMGTVISADMTTGSNTLTNCSSVNGYSVGDVLFDYAGDFSANPVITAINGNNIVLNLNALNTISAYDVINQNGYIKQEVSGTAPNRVCEFEFGNFTRFAVYDEVLNFKIRLYETSNKIEFVYGNMIPGQDATPCEVGLKGNSNSDFNSRKVNSPTLWSNSVASSLISDYCDFDPALFPSLGQSYMWTPISCTVPVLSVTSSNSIICAGESVELTASGATSYTWTNGPTASQNTVTPLVTSSYTVIGANQTCTSSITFTQDVAPNPTLTVTSNNTLLCSGQSVTLSASGATSYSWNGTPGTAQFIVSPTITTSYSVTASNGNCTAKEVFQQEVLDCTGLNEKAANISGKNLQVYPNPFQSELSVKNNGNTTLRIVISDALGRTVYSQNVKAGSVEVINTDHLKKGVYFCTTQSAEGSFTKKLIKE